MQRNRRNNSGACRQTHIHVSVAPYHLMRLSGFAYFPWQSPYGAPATFTNRAACGTNPKIVASSLPQEPDCKISTAAGGHAKCRVSAFCRGCKIIGPKLTSATLRHGIIMEIPPAQCAVSIVSSAIYEYQSSRSRPLFRGKKQSAGVVNATSCLDTFIFFPLFPTLVVHLWHDNAISK